MQNLCHAVALIKFLKDIADVICDVQQVSTHVAQVPAFVIFTLMIKEVLHLLKPKDLLWGDGFCTFGLILWLVTTQL